jgi:hypothetical protein
MRETRSSGSVEVVMSNRDPYSDCRMSLFVPLSMVRFVVTMRYIYREASKGWE